MEKITIKGKFYTVEAKEYFIKIDVDYNEVLEFEMWRNEHDTCDFLNEDYKDYCIDKMGEVAKRIEKDLKGIKWYDIIDILNDNYKQRRKEAREEASKILGDNNE